jgi:hypothetical protein
VQSFQTLQDPANPIIPPYFRERSVADDEPVEWQGFDFAANGEYVRFRQPALLNAERSVLYPTAMDGARNVVRRRARRGRI